MNTQKETARVFIKETHGDYCLATYDVVTREYLIADDIQWFEDKDECSTYRSCVYSGISIALWQLMYT